MTKDETQLAELLSMLGVDSLADASERVRSMLANAPAIGVTQNGALVVAPGMTIGAALALLDAGRDAIMRTKVS